MSAQFSVISAPCDVAPRGLPGDLFVDEVAFTLEAEPERPEAPACVAVAKLPRTRLVVRRPMTEEEAEMVKVIRRCVSYATGHWDKRFMRDLPEAITDKQAVQVWRIFKTYRRQIVTQGPEAVMTKERKDELLRKAEAVCAAMTKPEGGMTNE